MLTHEAFQWPYLIAGLIIGLFGWLLYWAGIPIMGGIIGASAGGFLGLVASEYLQQANPLILPGLGVVLGAILGILLMRAIQVYFFFTAGASMGGALAWFLLQRYYHTGSGTLDMQGTIIILSAALAGGLLIVYFRRFLVALATAAAGVVLVQYGLPAKYQVLGVLVSLVVFVSVQIGLVRRFVEKEEFDHRMKRYRRQRRDDLEEE